MRGTYEPSILSKQLPENVRSSLSLRFVQFPSRAIQIYNLSQ